MSMFRRERVLAFCCLAAAAAPGIAQSEEAVDSGAAKDNELQEVVVTVVRARKNELEIRVANLWVNRLIGDAQPGAAKVAFTTIPTYRADASLRASGLMGPVTILGLRRTP